MSSGCRWSVAANILKKTAADKRQGAVLQLTELRVMWIYWEITSRDWTLASTCHLSFSSHRACGVNWCFKQSAIASASSTGWNRSERQWMAVGASGPTLFVRDLAMGHTAEVFSQCLPVLFPILQVPFFVSCVQLFLRPNSLPFYIRDPFLRLFLSIKIR
jgi:hypothetical protein